MYLLFLYEEERCIEIAISGASPFPASWGGFAAFSLSTGAAFDCYDRCIEIAISGASLFPASGGGFAAFSSQVLVLYSTAIIDA
jgi:hypothetical protein